MSFDQRGRWIVGNVGCNDFVFALPVGHMIKVPHQAEQSNVHAVKKKQKTRRYLFYCLINKTEKSPKINVTPSCI